MHRDPTPTQALIDAVRDGNPLPAFEHSTLTVTNDILRRAALWYATKLGYPIFPADAKAALCRGGFHSATTDPVQIRKWWTWWPDASIGFPTGDVTGLDVIDIDGPVGLKWFRERLRKAPLPNIVGHAITGRGYGGHHLYVATTGGRTRPNFLPKLDYKANGGYVILPPSVSKSGLSYTWIDRIPPKGAVPHVDW